MDIAEYNCRPELNLFNIYVNKFKSELNHLTQR